MANIIGGSIGAGKAILHDYTLGVEDIDGGHRLTITRGSEVQIMDVLDGKNGADGKDGSPGAVQTVNGEAPDENGNVHVSGLPEGASANQQLATDKDGIVKWEEKPFYTTQDVEEITWDGDTAGREEVPFGDTGSFYKISDTIYPPDGIIGSTFTIMNNGVPEDIVITDKIFIDVSGNLPGTWFVSYDGAPVLGSGPALDYVSSSGGLYYLKTDTYYVSSLSLIKTTIKEIDPVYIPEIPAEKLPDVFDTKDLVVKLENFSLYILTQIEQPSFKFSNVTYSELLDAAKKSKVILGNVSNASQIIPNKTEVLTDGKISLEILFYYSGYIHVIQLMCRENNTNFYRNSWHKVAAE